MTELATAILESTGGKLIFQLRDEKEGIASSGKITLFGGHVEAGETPILGLIRELKEELELEILPEQAEHFIELKTTWNDKLRNVFVVKGVDASKLVLHEGQAILELSKEDVLKSANISYMTKAMLNMYWASGEI